MKFALTLLTTLLACAAVNSADIPSFGEGPLYNDLEYFMKMMPTQKINEIMDKHYTEDPDFRRAVEKLISEDFRQLIKDIERIPEVLNLFAYLEEKGIHIYEIINTMNRGLGIDHVVPVSAEKPAQGGLVAAVKEVRAIIPVDDLIHGYVYKLRTSEAFRDFIDQLKSDNYQIINEKIYSHPIFLRMRQHVIDEGVDVQLTEDITTIVLGVEFPNIYQKETSLSEDIDDFMNLAITEQVMNVLIEYLFTNQEIQKGILFAQSEEFHKLLRDIEGLKEHQAYIKYLEDSGLEMKKYVQELHKFIRMEAQSPNKGSNGANKYESLRKKNSSAVREMVDKMIEFMPTEQIKIMHKEKLNSSPAFAKFVQRIYAPEFKKIVNSFVIHPVFIRMQVVSKAAGLDFDPLFDLFAAIVAIHRV